MRLGDFEVEGHLGAGGMSEVWLARGGRGLVVLKRQLNPEDDERLRDEAHVGMRLSHPSVVRTLDLFELDGRPMLVLEYVAGASLVALRKRGALPPEAVCRIGADIAEGLAALHDAVDERGQPLRVLHRDVSPANIIVAHDGRARLIDLGIARFAESAAERTRTGDLKGTIRYLAPELFDAKLHSAKTDLWALGVCLFEAALGRQAVTGPEAVILAAIVRGTLLDFRPGEKIAPLLDAAIRRLCAPVDKRIASGNAAAQLFADTEIVFGDGRRKASVAVYATVDAAPLSTPARGVAAPSLVPQADDDLFAKYAATTYCGVDETDDDPFDPFGSEQVETAATPSRSRPTSSPGSASASVPTPITVLGQTSAPTILIDGSLEADSLEADSLEADSLEADSLEAESAPASVDLTELPHTPSSPGARPAGTDSWTLPQPITGGEPLAFHAGALAAQGASLDAAIERAIDDDGPRPMTLADVVDDAALEPLAHNAAELAPGAFGFTAADAADAAPAEDELESLRKSAVGSYVPFIAAAGVVVMIIVAFLLLRD